MTAEFCDTNIIVYAYDTSAVEKRANATQLLARLWASGEGAVSVQVLQEVFVTLTEKLSLAPTDAKSIVSDMTTWQVIAPEASDVLDAIDEAWRWKIGFWDAMILVAVKKAGASVVWSEDLSNGQSYDGVEVRNPFVATHRG